MLAHDKARKHKTMFQNKVTGRNSEAEHLENLGFSRWPHLTQWRGSCSPELELTTHHVREALCFSQLFQLTLKHSSTKPCETIESSTQAACALTGLTGHCLSPHKACGPLLHGTWALVTQQFLTHTGSGACTIGLTLNVSLSY